jgi:hypothetical protein
MLVEAAKKGFSTETPQWVYDFSVADSPAVFNAKRLSFKCMNSLILKRPNPAGSV